MSQNTRPKKQLRTLSSRMSTTSFLLFFFVGSSVLAAPPEYVPLVGLPQLQNASGDNLADYFNNLYIIAIAIGALIGVVKIAMAGVKYSLSDVITNKESARNDIKGVLMGLAILLIPFIVLNTIYPGLTDLNILKGAQRTTINVTPSPKDPTAYDPGTTVTDNIATMDCPVGQQVFVLSDGKKECRDANTVVNTDVTTGVQLTPVSLNILNTHIITGQLPKDTKPENVLGMKTITPSQSDQLLLGTNLETYKTNIGNECSALGGSITSFTKAGSSNIPTQYYYCIKK